VIRALDLKQNVVKTILNDLTVQGIISREKSESSSHYELKHNTPRLNVRASEELRKAKLTDFERMKGYMGRDSCRMNYLRQYLGGRENLKGAFRIGEDVKQKRILLVDDIMDSGATIREIASALKSAGASMVVPLVIVL
jgi:phosphoribosylpyrophosphate synthetase